MRIFIYALYLSFNTCLLIGQPTEYDRLFNQGQLPEDYTQPSYEKYLQSLRDANLQINNPNADQNQFYLETIYVIDELLRSGYILYNDPIGDYVNAVLDVIVAGNPRLEEISPRVYIFRSTEVNAFAVDQGIIFVSIGLLSQLENEAQLALILSHELVHIQESHGLDGFLEATRIDRKIEQKGEINTKQIDIASLEENRYSREQEIEADDKGLTYFLNTNYSFASILRVFDVLRYSYLPYDEIPFEKEILEKLSVIIPEDHLLEELQAINPAEEDEEQSTHPALSKRTQNFRQRLEDLTVNEEQVYIVSEASFKAIQMKSRIELARLFLEGQELSEAIYSGFLITKIYGESNFTREIIGEALYGLAKFKNNKLTRNLSSPKARKVEGESQQAFHIIEKIHREEFNILAIAYNYDRYMKEPDNESLRALIVDLFSDLYFFHEINSLDAFFVIDRVTIDSVKIEAEIEAEAEELFKIDKIRQNRQQRGAEDWHLLAFSSVLEDPVFGDIAQEGFDAGLALEERQDYYSTSHKQGRTNAYQYKKEIKRNGFSLGIDSVLIFNPLFIHLNAGIKEGDIEMDYIESDDRQVALKEIIESSAEVNGMNIQFLDAKSLGANAAEELNDIMVVNEWIDTQMDADDFLFQSYNQEEIQAFADKYNTPYIMSVVVISARHSSGLRRFFNKKAVSFIFVAVYDVRDGKRAFIKSDFLSFYINDVFLKSELYDAFHQVSKTN